MSCTSEVKDMLQVQRRSELQSSDIDLRMDQSSSSDDGVFLSPASSSVPRLTPKSSMTNIQTPRSAQSSSTPGCPTTKSPAVFKSPIGTPLYRSNSFNRSDMEMSPATSQQVKMSPLAQSLECSPLDPREASPRVILKFSEIRDHGLQRASVTTSFSTPESPNDLNLKNISHTLLRKPDIPPGTGAVRKMEFCENERSPDVAAVMEKSRKKRQSEGNTYPEDHNCKRSKSLCWSTAENADKKQPSYEESCIGMDKDITSTQDARETPDASTVFTSSDIMARSVSSTRRKLALDKTPERPENTSMSTATATVASTPRYPEVCTLTLGDLQSESPYRGHVELYGPSEPLCYPPNVSLTPVPPSCSSHVSQIMSTDQAYSKEFPCARASTQPSMDNLNRYRPSGDPFGVGVVPSARKYYSIGGCISEVPSAYQCSTPDRYGPYAVRPESAATRSNTLNTPDIHLYNSNNDYGSWTSSIYKHPYLDQQVDTGASLSSSKGRELKETPAKHPYYLSSNPASPGGKTYSVSDEFSTPCSASYSASTYPTSTEAAGTRQPLPDASTHSNANQQEMSCNMCYHCPSHDQSHRNYFPHTVHHRGPPEGHPSIASSLDRTHSAASADSMPLERMTSHNRYDYSIPNYDQNQMTIPHPPYGQPSYHGYTNINVQSGTPIQSILLQSRRNQCENSITTCSSNHANTQLPGIYDPQQNTSVQPQFTPWRSHDISPFGQSSVPGIRPHHVDQNYWDKPGLSRGRSNSVSVVYMDNASNNPGQKLALLYSDEQGHSVLSSPRMTGGATRYPECSRQLETIREQADQPKHQNINQTPMKVRQVSEACYAAEKRKLAAALLPQVAAQEIDARRREWDDFTSYNTSRDTEVVDFSDQKSSSYRMEASSTVSESTSEQKARASESSPLKIVIENVQSLQRPNRIESGYMSGSSETHLLHDAHLTGENPSLPLQRAQSICDDSSPCEDNVFQPISPAKSSRQECIPKPVMPRAHQAVNVVSADTADRTIGEFEVSPQTHQSGIAAAPSSTPSDALMPSMFGPVITSVSSTQSTATSMYTITQPTLPLCANQNLNLINPFTYTPAPAPIVPTYSLMLNTGTNVAQSLNVTPLYSILPTQNQGTSERPVSSQHVQYQQQVVLNSMTQVIAAEPGPSSSKLEVGTSGGGVKILPSGSRRRHSPGGRNRSRTFSGSSGDAGSLKDSACVSSTTSGFQMDSAAPKSRFFSLLSLEIGSFTMCEPDNKKRLSRVQFQFNVRKVTYEIPYLKPDSPSENGFVHIALVDVPFHSIVGINIVQNKITLEVNSPPSIKTKDRFGRGAKNQEPGYDPTDGQVGISPYHKIGLRPDVPARVIELLIATDSRFLTLSIAPLEVNGNKQLAASGGEASYEEHTDHRTASHKNTCCSCSTGCLFSRCKCASAIRQCVAKCKCTQVLANCQNPVNQLAKHGVDIDRARRDPCLIANIFRIKLLGAYLVKEVLFVCCGVTAPISRVIPGEVKCPRPDCSHRYKYSWCTGILMDSTSKPRNHCHICCRCTEHNSVHCDQCNSCFLPTEDVPECPCNIKRALDSRKNRIQQQIRAETFHQTEMDRLTPVSQSGTPSCDGRASSAHSDIISLDGSSMAIVNKSVVMEIIDSAMDTNSCHASPELGEPVCSMHDMIAMIDDSETESETELTDQLRFTNLSGNPTVVENVSVPWPPVNRSLSRDVLGEPLKASSPVLL